MGKDSKSKKSKRKGKKIRKGRKHQSLKIFKFYDIKDGSVQRKSKFCPRCGDGNWLSSHTNRLYCGRCGYTELGKKEPEKEAVKASS